MLPSGDCRIEREEGAVGRRKPVFVRIDDLVVMG